MAKKLSQTQQHSIKKKNEIRVEFHDFFTNMRTLREQPISNVFLEELALEFLDWAIDDDDALKVLPFFRKKGINTTDLKRWRERCPKFDAAYIMGKEAIGDRRECGAIKRKFAERIISSSMPHYDRAWGKLEEWRSGLRASEQEEKATTFNINIPQFQGNDNDGSGESV